MVDINSVIEGTVKFRDGKKVSLKFQNYRINFSSIFVLLLIVCKLKIIVILCNFFITTLA